MKADRIVERRPLNYPTAVRKHKGAEGSKTLCAGSEGALRLVPGSYVVYDMGGGSVGGYPFFIVKSFKGKPTLHISYSDRMTPYEREDTMEKGDFTRGSCQYLGVELPVMPANPYRYEDYTIGRTGLFVYPLIQGQERFVCLSVLQESEGEVTVSRFGIADDSPAMELSGSFRCDDERLERIWQASARTLRLATVQAKQWDVLFGKLFIRKLTKGEYGALGKRNTGYPFRIRCTIELCRNPEYETGAELLFSAKDMQNFLYLRVMQTGEMILGRTEQGIRKVLRKEFVGEIADNMPCGLEVSADESGVQVFKDGRAVMSVREVTAQDGRIGFGAEGEWRSVVDELSVESGGETVYEWKGKLSDFLIGRSGYYISDGAKRDRLPWTGDLDWAFDSGWYAFGDRMDAMNTLRILAFHQNPEGFVYGTCYPENKEKPKSGEYGYYQSDMFAAWFAVSAFTYYRLSGDLAFHEMYGVIRDCLEYLWRYVDETDGLFDQRYETSKGLWDHVLGDTGKNTYTNLILLEALQNAAAYAKERGEAAYAAKCESRAARLREGIFRYLYDAELGGFIKRKGWRELCDMANPFAMGKHLVNSMQAAQIAAHAEQVTHAYGKITILMIHGLYDYGYAEEAKKLLYGKLPLYIDGFYYSSVDWMSVIGHPDLPETVYECMHNPPFDFGPNLNWGDLSHPDSGVSGVISGHIAGIQAAGTGFSSVKICPHPGDLKKIECEVPTRYGKIEMRLKADEAGSSVTVSLPEGIRYEADFTDLVQPVKFVVNYTDKKELKREVV